MEPNRKELFLKIVERALQLNDDKLTHLLVEAGIVKPFEMKVDFKDGKVFKVDGAPAGTTINGAPV